MTRVKVNLIEGYNDKQFIGGGYLLWTSYVICQETVTFRILFIILAIFYLSYLVLFLSSATDE
jgi:hypothetical protein